MKTPEKYRLKYGTLASAKEDGNNGAFIIPFENNILHVIASDGGDWEHVSVSMKNRCPNWKEMCFIKSLFWDDEDIVIQYHPPKKDYINNHNFCLHLWRPTKESIPMPPSIMIGIKI